MRKLAAIFTLFLGIHTSVSAVEGMWIPSLIDMFHSDMVTYGLKLNADEIYSTNQASLKDAIVQFNGGCTAEIVSDQGLILTNHHCGFDAIQKHSSLEHDYLRDGFWAKNFDEELACPWLRVTFVREIRDVTEDVLAGVTESMSSEKINMLIKENIAKLEEDATSNNSHIKAKIKPFNLGNEYYMLITEDYNDIRLVGTPPSAIGKYGGDTDNWVWPRHTGDFSVFRIYANQNNESAKYSEDNQPYKPAHSLPISCKPKKSGDFTMIYGFPGHTDQHYASGKLKFYMETERPARIKMRQKTLDIIKPAMNANQLTKIQYASKQARIANAWKKWIGQIGGLKQLNALSKKQNFEEEYMAKAAEKTDWKKNYYGVVADLNKLQAQNEKYELARAMFIEYFYVGAEIIRFSNDFEELAFSSDKLESEGKLDEAVNKLLRRSKNFYKNYNADLDMQILTATTPVYLEYTSADLIPDGLNQNWENIVNDIQENSVFRDSSTLQPLLENWGKKSIKKLQKDPALLYSMKLMNAYRMKVAPKYAAFVNEEEKLMKRYVGGMLEMFPDKKIWADANSTLRIAYGKLEGSAPHDGMQYLHYTTIDGIMQKYDPENPDFVLTDRFIELYKKGDFGDYLQDDELWVCFTASNHTTGGNSGSPCIDAEGNLIGINFDRSWESTMSDFMFDESRCRNIIVDIRYVLWVIDKYGEASHLVDEMNIVK